MTIKIFYPYTILIFTVWVAHLNHLSMFPSLRRYRWRGKRAHPCSKVINKVMLSTLATSWSVRRLSPNPIDKIRQHSKLLQEPLYPTSLLKSLIIQRNLLRSLLASILPPARKLMNLHCLAPYPWDKSAKVSAYTGLAAEVALPCGFCG